MLRNKAILWVIIIILVGITGYLLINSVQNSSRAKEQSNKNIIVKEEGKILLTIFLKHDQGKTLDEIQKKLNENGFYRKFPPSGTEIESWKVVMGIGQVVTLRVPPSKLREVNVALETMAWGSFKTEFYPSYDFVPIYKAYRDTVSNIDSTKITLE